MYYLNSRYCSLEWGRFINADADGGKVGDLLSHNVFAYCMNNPVNLEDPSGNWPKLGKILKIAAVVAVVAIAVVCIVQPELIPIAANAVIDAYYYAGAVYTTTGWKAVQVLGRGAQGAEKAIGESNCFVAGTMVVTQDGMKSIENIKTGDKVYSENPDTGQKEYKEVKQTFVHEVDTLVHVSIGDTKLDTTEGHRFWVVDKGWVEAKDLKVSDKVLLSSGKIAFISKVAIEKLKAKVKVYNFEVQDWHTYFVSNVGVLVHNMCGENGTQVTSKTTWKNGKTERIDVENPLPGLRPGDVHYHEPNNTKWRFDIEVKKFVNPKTFELAPNKIQKSLNNPGIQGGINKGLEILGEKAIKIF